MLTVYIKNVIKKKLLFSTGEDKPRLVALIKKNYPDCEIVVNQTNILIYENNKKSTPKKRS